MAPSQSKPDLIITIIKVINILRTKIFSRFLSFIRSSKTSSKECLATLVNRACCDQGSITRQNLNIIEEISGYINILEQEPRSILNMEHAAIPAGEEWRVDLLNELMQLRWNNFFLEGDHFTRAEYEVMIK